MGKLNSCLNFQHGPSYLTPWSEPTCFDIAQLLQLLIPMIFVTTVFHFTKRLHSRFSFRLRFRRKWKRIFPIGYPHYIIIVRTMDYDMRESLTAGGIKISHDILSLCLLQCHSLGHFCKAEFFYITCGFLIQNDSNVLKHLMNCENINEKVSDRFTDIGLKERVETSQNWSHEMLV